MFISEKMGKCKQPDVSTLDKKKCNEAAYLKIQYMSLKECLDDQKKIVDMKKEGNIKIVNTCDEKEKRNEDSGDANLVGIKKNFNNETDDNTLYKLIRETESNINSFNYLIPFKEYIEKRENDKTDYISEIDMGNKNESEEKHEFAYGTESNVEHSSNLKELHCNVNSIENKITEDKMNTKIKKLLQLINVLKEQMDQKDKDIYRMETALPIKKWRTTKKGVCPEDMLNVGYENVESIQEDKILLEKNRCELMNQKSDISFLKEQLEKKNEELHLLKCENKLKNEMLVETKNDLEKNYFLLTQYKDKLKKCEKKLNRKLNNIKSCLNSKTPQNDETDLYLDQKNWDLKRQNKITLILSEELKKKDKMIHELKNIVENVGVNNNRDVIKYKQSNIDLLNKLNLNTSLLNSQRMEIESLHFNFRQMEEDLRNKDEEIKKLHESLLNKEDENNKLKSDINKLMFDLEIKNVNIINIKKNMKTVRKENLINLKKQKEQYIITLREECKERDTTIINKTNEIEKLVNEYNQLGSINEILKKQVDELTKTVLKKEKAIADMQDKLLGYQAKLVVYENNNEIQTLKKNEEQLRKKLDEQLYRNEQLVNNSVLLKKSTVENYALEKQILELKGALYAKDEEIKKLKMNCKKGTTNFSADDNSQVKPMLYNNGLPLKPAVALTNSDDENTSESLITNYNGANFSKKKFIPNKDDPVDLALNDYLNCFTKNKYDHKPFQVKKVNTNIYYLNGNRVIIRFYNGELFVEDNSHPIKLQNYLIKIINT